MNCTFHDVRGTVDLGLDTLYLIVAGTTNSTFSNLTFRNITDGDLFRTWAQAVTTGTAQLATPDIEAPELLAALRVEREQLAAAAC